MLFNFLKTMTNKTTYPGIPDSVFKYNPKDKQNVSFEHDANKMRPSMKVVYKS
jgi:hypothetical protein